MTSCGGDLRVHRTRSALQGALLELLGDCPFGAVTVRELTRRAVVNRTTFYRHFRDKEDLALSVFEDFVVDLSVAPPDLRGVGRDGCTLDAVCVRMLQHVQQHAGLYRALLLGPQAAWFSAAVRCRTGRLLVCHWPVAWSVTGRTRPSPPATELAAGSVVAGLAWSLEQRKPPAAEAVARCLAAAACATLASADGDRRCLSHAPPPLPPAA